MIENTNIFLALFFLISVIHMMVRYIGPNSVLRTVRKVLADFGRTVEVTDDDAIAKRKV